MFLETLIVLVLLAVIYGAYYYTYEVSIPEVHFKANNWNKKILARMPILREPYYPHFFLSHFHLQMIFGTVLLQHRIAYKFDERKIITLKDGINKVALDFAGFSTITKPTAPILIILHGSVFQIRVFLKKNSSFNNQSTSNVKKHD